MTVVVADPVTEYAEHVLAGEFVTGKLVRLACARHLRDMELGESRGLTFDPDAAQHAIDFFGFLRHSKGEWAGKVVELELWQQFMVGSLFGWKRADGTRRFRTAYNEIARKNGKSTLAAGIALYLLVGDNEPGSEVYCLDESTPVLCEDMRWKPVGDLRVGDALVGFDEHPPVPGGFRKLRQSLVTSTDRVVQPTYRLSFSDGRTVVASAGHLWLGKKSSKNDLKVWLRTDKLRVGSAVRDLVAPWSEDTSREAGYLAGVFDGEGCFHGRAVRAGFRISFAQRPGVVLERTRKYLTERGYDISAKRKHVGGVDTFEIAGLRECFRFLGEIRPARLLERAAEWYVGRSPSRAGGHLEVTAVEYLGEREVVAMGTSTATMFANGLFSHNCAATKRDQAKIVFDEAANMVKRSPSLGKRVREFARNLSVPSTMSKMEPLGADADTMDGLNPHGVIIDELHAHRNSGVVDVLDTATGSRRQALQFEITTAGYDRASICYAHRTYATQILEGIVEDDAWFVYVATIDPQDDWRDPATWAKANPNLGVSVKLDDLAKKCETASQMPAAQNAFKRLRLNVWTEQADRWLDLDVWDANGGTVDEDELAGEVCFGGLDLSMTTDITALVYVFPPTDERLTWCVVPRFFIPGDAIKKRSDKDRVPYDQWSRDGQIIRTEGNVVDYEVVQAQVVEDAKKFRVREVAYDRFNATQLVTNLTGEGLDMVPFGQGFVSMSAPTKELEKLLLSKSVAHGGQPVLRWMAANVAVRQDPAGNLKPDKQKSTERIDGIVATIMALGRAMITAADGESVYESRGVLTF